jgi:hypothetical protein
MAVILHQAAGMAKPVIVKPDAVKKIEKGLAIFLV